MPTNPKGKERGKKAPGEVIKPKAGPDAPPGGWQTVPQDTVDLVIANGGTASGWVHIGNPAECGLFVPTLTASTLWVEVAYASDGTGGAKVFNGTGTQELNWASGTGAFNVSSLAMAAVLGWGYMRVVCGSAQGADRTFKLTRKSVQI